MKKLFTTILMMGVALCTWALPPGEEEEILFPLEDGVLTIDYNQIPYDLQGNPQMDKIVKEEYRLNIEKLVLTGGFSNKDFAAGEIVEKILDRACKKPGGPGQPEQKTTLYLDLSGCTNIISKVEYIGTASAPDYATKDFKYVYSTSTDNKQVTKGTFWVEENGCVYAGDVDNDGRPVGLKQEVDGDVTKYYYSQLYEMGTLYNKPYKVLEDANGKYYHLFYDASGGNPGVYTGAYQAEPNNDLPDLPSDETGYYFVRYFDAYGNSIQNPAANGYTYDGTGYFNSKSYYRNVDGKKIESWEMYKYPNGVGKIIWDIDNNCEYTGDQNSLKQEGDKWYYYEYYNETTQTAITDNNEIANINNGNGIYAGRQEIRDGNGVLTGYQLTNGTIISITKHEVIRDYEVTVEERPDYLREEIYYLEERKYYLEERNTYVEEKELWYYTENGKKYFVNEDDVEVDENDANIGYINATATGDAFTFEKVGPYLNGVSFPNHANFTAIPDQLCMAQYCPALATVVLGNSVEWIGNKAFFQLRNLENVTYPNGDDKTGHVSFPSAMKAIGVDAFRGCWKFTDVNLNLDNLVRLDAAAFNMEDPTKNNLANVILPTASVNNTLKFWGNQVFSSTHITKLDLENLYAIEHFAYDGYNSMGETAVGVGQIAATATFTWMTYLEELILPKNLLYAPGGGDKNSGMCSNCTSLTKVVFTGVPEFDGCEITNKVIIGEYCFRDLPLTDIQLSDNVAEIYERAFDELAQLEAVEIPASVEELKNYAFNHCSNLKVVTFKDTPKSFPEGCNGPVTNVRGGAGAGAFYNCQAITDVYVNRQEPALKCENYSFDFFITWGHGDPTRALATLHFPKSHVDNYVNLKHYLTNEIVADPGKFHDWLMDHVDLAVVPNKNGWYEFVNAGPVLEDNGPGTQDIVLRTFSDWQYSYLVPNGLRAYVVNDIAKEESSEAGKYNYIVTLQRLRVIPANTGVILYGHPNAKSPSGKSAISMTPVAYAKAGDKVIVDGVEVEVNEDQGQPLCRANWGNLKGADVKYKNYLEPTSTPTQAEVDQIKDATEKARLQALIDAHAEANDWKDGGKYIKPFENIDEFDEPLVTKPTKPVAYRNYVLGRYSDTENLSVNKPLPEGDGNNYVGFFRAIKGYYKNAQAYLHLKGAFEEDGTAITDPTLIEYNEKTGAEILVQIDEPKPEDIDIDNDVIPYYYEYGVADGIAYNARTATTKIKEKYIDEQGQEQEREVTKTMNPYGWWDESHTPAFTWTEPILSWGKRSDYFGNTPSGVNYFGELEEDTDGVVKLVIPAETISNGDYYTLQGIKVNNPTKGVYIHNGKKVILK